MFVLNRVVVHEINKVAQSTDVQTDLSETLGDNGDATFSSLVSSINTLYTTTPSVKNSHFAADSDTPFSTHLKRYLEDSTDENFYNFTVSAIQNLATQIASVRLATGGFYCFADFESQGRRYVSVTLLRRKDAITFVKHGGIFQASSQASLNFDKIAMGFRLNVEIYNSEEDNRNYIGLVAPLRGDELSTYFRRWVCIADLISNDQNTNALVALVRHLPIPVDEENRPRYSEEDFRRAIYEYVEHNSDRKVNLLTMSAYFYGPDSERLIVEKAESRNITIDHEFPRTAKVWKRLIKIKVKVPGIEINVDYDKINPNEVDVHSDHIIIRSEDLANLIRQQMNG